jgi:hypothetical protein
MLSLSLSLAAGIAAIAVSVVGCTAAIGLSDYTFGEHGADGGPPDASSATLPDRTEPRGASAGDADAGGSDASTGDAGAAGSDASEGDADAGGSDAADAASCSVDLATTCYPCAPATQPQFLNACTSAACVPFDDTRVTLLLPDGGLPPLTMRVDAGTH